MRKIDLSQIVRAGLLELQPYSSARDEFDNTDEGSSEMIYLDANENPFSTAYNRYPDPHQRKLKQKLSAIKRVPAACMFLGNGSDEAIDLIIRLFCRPGKDNLLIPTPTYGMYKVSAGINDVAVREIALSKEFQPDVAAILATADENSKIIFLCSPNNPSANLMTEDAIVTVLESFRGIVVIDEAYIEFSGNSSWAERLTEFPNLIVLQTLSKAWGLAGLRLGIAFAQAEIIKLLDRIKPPYNISSVTQKIALDALEHEDVKNAWVAGIIRERERVGAALSQMDRVEHVYPSNANFLLVRIADASRMYDQLIEQHIVVRDRSKVIRCDNCLRITIGTPIENDQLISALKNL